jgi:hypothetical protein
MNQLLKIMANTVQKLDLLYSISSIFYSSFDIPDLG